MDAYNHETVTLDGGTFDAAEFRDCRLVYSGGAAPKFSDCKFVNCEWKFEGEAANTLVTLKRMWGVGAKQVVQAMIKDITEAKGG